jgi:hypothetical protein
MRRPFLWDAPRGTPHATNPGSGTRMLLRHRPKPNRRPPLFGLAPGGVCRAVPVAGGAVRSCRTVSPLPAGVASGAGGLFSVARSLGSPPPAVSRHRIPVEPGLSSAGHYPSGGRPVVWQCPVVPARAPRQWHAQEARPGAPPLDPATGVALGTRSFKRLDSKGSAFGGVEGQSPSPCLLDDRHCRCMAWRLLCRAG